MLLHPISQVPETLPEEVLAKKGAPPKDSSVPIIAADMLADFDGFIFGFPTWYECFGCLLLTIVVSLANDENIERKTSRLELFLLRPPP